MSNGGRLRSHAGSLIAPDGRWELRGVQDATELRSTAAADGPGLLPNSFRAEFTWSPDGEWVIWSGRADDRDETAPDLFAIHLANGSPIRVIDTDPQETMPVWGGAVMHATDVAGR